MSENPSAPLFAPTEPGLSEGATAAVAQRGTPATLNLDDIFGDVLFTPDGETVFMSEVQGEEAGPVVQSGEGDAVATQASRVVGDKLVPVANAGGIQTTNLLNPEKKALTMGAATAGSNQTSTVPFKRAPQQRHHLQYAAPEMVAAMKKRSRSAAGGGKGSERKMSEQQKVERR